MERREKTINPLSCLSQIVNIITSRESFDNIIKQVVYTIESEFELQNTHIKILNFSKKFGGYYGKREEIESKLKFPSEDIIDLEEGRKLVVVPIRFEGRDLGFISSIAFAVSEDRLKVLRATATMLGMAFFLIGKEKTEIRKIGDIIYVSKKMGEVVKSALKVAETDATVLILGESGVGKELIAELIHKNSKRKDAPLVKINCAGIPETLLESELFGFKKGAFTGALYDKKGKFELADGGTIFLDEIGDMPLHLQPKILRVIQTKEIEPIGGQIKKVDVRIIAATNKNLEELVKQGKFREDLYYRLFVVPIYIPPLRERKDDIPVLVEYFLEKFNAKYKKSISISKSVLEVFQNYDWPGNVRELENLIERLVITTSDFVITPEHLPEYIKKTPTYEQDLMGKETQQESKQELRNFQENKRLEEIISEIEKKAIIDAITKSKNISEAAKKLGITRRQLEWRMKKYNIRK